MSITLTERELIALRLICDDYYGPIEGWDNRERMLAWSIVDEITMRAGVHPDYDEDGEMRAEGLPQPRLSAAEARPEDAKP